MFTTFVLLGVAVVLKGVAFVVEYGLDEAIKQKEKEESDNE